MNHTDQELNRVLAKVAGVEIKQHQEDGPAGIREGWVYLKQRDERHEIWLWWEPLTDANQMKLVKSALRVKYISYASEWGALEDVHTCQVWGGDPGSENIGVHEDELTAFALAVQAMGKGEEDSCSVRNVTS